MIREETTTKEVTSSVSELTDLMNDTFTCCLRNYEALLPYLEKKKGGYSVCSKLIQINVLLNKLNEELVELGDELVTACKYESKTDNVLCGKVNKRKYVNVTESDAPGTKIMKTDNQYSDSADYFTPGSRTSTVRENSNSRDMKTTENFNTDKESATSRNRNVTGFSCVKEADETSKTELQPLNDDLNFPLCARDQFCEMSNGIVTKTISEKQANKTTTTIFAFCDDVKVLSQNVGHQNVHQNSKVNSSTLVRKELHEPKELSVKANETLFLHYQKSSSSSSLGKPAALAKISRERVPSLKGSVNTHNREDQRERSKSHSNVSAKKVSETQCCLKRILRCVLCSLNLPNLAVVHTHVNGRKHQLKLKQCFRNKCATNTISEKQANKTATTIFAFCDDVEVLSQNVGLQYDNQNGNVNSSTLVRKEHHEPKELSVKANETLFLHYQESSSPSSLEKPAASAKISCERVPSLKGSANTHNREDQMEISKSHSNVSGSKVSETQLYNKRLLRCVLCNMNLIGHAAVLRHVNGRKHQLKLKQCFRNKRVRNRTQQCVASNDSTVSSTSQCVDASVVPPDNDSFTNNHHLDYIEYVVNLDEVWQSISESFWSNKRYFYSLSGRVICLLCKSYVRVSVNNVKLHITEPAHARRLAAILEIERLSKLLGEELLDIPDIITNAVPKIFYSFECNKYFCKLCYTSCECTNVLQHMTNKKDAKKSISHLHWMVKERENKLA